MIFAEHYTNPAKKKGNKKKKKKEKKGGRGGGGGGGGGGGCPVSPQNFFGPDGLSLV